MDQNLKNRLVGVAVICALAVIFLPMILDGEGVLKEQVEVSIPPQPLVTADAQFETRVIELHKGVAELPEPEDRFVDENSSVEAAKPAADPTPTVPDNTAQTASESKSDSSRQQQTKSVATIADDSTPRVGGESWVLQVGSFQDRQKALSQRDKLRQSRIAAVFIEQFSVDGKTSYRVRLGPFLSREQTRVAQNKIKAKHDIDGIIILVIIVLSALISLIRGFVKESISLVTWIAAGLLAFRYFSPMSQVFEPYIAAPMGRAPLGFGLIFVLTLIAGAIVNFIVSQLVSKTGLSGTDKALGVVFGGARGVLIVTVLVLLAGLTPVIESAWWQDSASVGFFEEIGDWLKSVIPDDAVDGINF